MFHSQDMVCLGFFFSLNFKMRWEQGIFFNQQDACHSPCLIWTVQEGSIFFPEGILSNIFEVVSYREKCWALCKQKLTVFLPVRCVELFSLILSLVVLILNKQRQSGWWWKMVSKPEGLFWSALNLWLPGFPNFPFPGHL